MKKYALIAICSLAPTLSLFSHQCEVKSLVHDKIQNLSFILHQYEYQGCKYELDFNYHVGYIRGQIKAYEEVQDLMHRL